MAKKSGSVKALLHFVVWLTGIIVALAVGFALTGGTLAVPYIGQVNVIAGWVVIFTTALSVILAVVHKFQ